ncbi:hypothetical protein DID74_02695 [Candidatus Marinamargulisbacteria bacterium SCGC AG-333-B06]|nr:hypothetical protein DID74_02695 [Candidatus Marinamargulisbacteria bacterium SCGC AG-333-B06]
MSDSASTSTSFSEPVKKVATLLLFLEMNKPALSKGILKAMGEAKSRIVLEAMASLGNVDKSSLTETVLQFHELFVEKKVVIGGKNLSSMLFQQAFDDVDKKSAVSFDKPFQYLESIDNDAILAMFDRLSNQMKALILYYLGQEKTTQLLQKMDTETSKLLFKKVFNVNVISADYVSKLDKKLYDQFMSASGEQSTKGMVAKFAAILEQTATEKRNDLLATIEEENPELLEEIKANMLSFENFIKLKDEELQLILSNVDIADLSYALQNVEDTLSEKITTNISSRAKNILEYINYQKNSTDSTVQRRHKNPKSIEQAKEILRDLNRPYETHEKSKPKTTKPVITEREIENIAKELNKILARLKTIMKHNAEEIRVELKIRLEDMLKKTDISLCKDHNIIRPLINQLEEIINGPIIISVNCSPHNATILNNDLYDE